MRALPEKTELGRVYYLTLTLHFPKEFEQPWIKQRPIPGASAEAIFRFVNKLGLSNDRKRELCRNLKTEWKDRAGFWYRMRIETTKRNSNWGNLDKWRLTH